jgi:hypothetical protein
MDLGFVHKQSFLLMLARSGAQVSYRSAILLSTRSFKSKENVLGMNWRVGPPGVSVFVHNAIPVGGRRERGFPLAPRRPK